MVEPSIDELTSRMPSDEHEETFEPPVEDLKVDQPLEDDLDLCEADPTRCPAKANLEPPAEVEVDPESFETPEFQETTTLAPTTAKISTSGRPISRSAPEEEETFHSGEGLRPPEPDISTCMLKLSANKWQTLEEFTTTNLSFQIGLTAFLGLFLLIISLRFVFRVRKPGKSPLPAGSGNSSVKMIDNTREKLDRLDESLKSLTLSMESIQQNLGQAPQNVGASPRNVEVDLEVLRSLKEILYLLGGDQATYVPE